MFTNVKWLMLALMAAGAGSLYAGGSYSLNDWILGTNSPEVQSGVRGDGSTGNYIDIPVGTSQFYYEASAEGEGSVTMWINDPGNCLAATNLGYPTRGPQWGLMTSIYNAFTVGINRSAYLAGCQGYSPWSTVAPYNAYWFRDGVRGSQSAPFTPGWYKWTVTGTWDAISFTLHDTYYETQDGPPHDDLVFGDVTKVYNATSYNRIWETVFGDGWKSLYFAGDGTGGVEDISMYLAGGTGIFADITPDPVVLPLTTLLGTVTANHPDSGSVSVPGARVVLSRTGVDPETTVTGTGAYDSGKYSFEDIASDTGYVVTVSKEGFITSSVSGLTLNGNYVQHNVELVRLPDTVVYETFVADTSADSVLLTWTTSREYNNQGWFVYRSTERQTGYERISTVSVSGKGAVYDTSGGTYSFVDTFDTSGTYYYYLEQVSTDLTLRYSDTLGIDVTSGIFDMQVNVSLPFPLMVRYDAGTHAVRLRADMPEAMEMSVRAFALNGGEQSVLHNAPLSTGAQNLALPFTAPAGLYLLDVAAGPYREAFKLLITP